MNPPQTTLYSFVCPNGCRYAPGYVGKKPIGGQTCHRCHQPLIRFEFKLPKFEGSE